MPQELKENDLLAQHQTDIATIFFFRCSQSPLSEV